MIVPDFVSKSDRCTIRFFNCDCNEFMVQASDKSYGLSCIDPPYGIGEGGGKCRTRKKHNNKVKHIAKDWDTARPTAEYFSQLFRVSKNQIIWGANYFTEYLPPSMGWVFWNKQIGGDFSDGELAFTSFPKALKMFTYWNGNNGIARIHPTQKPVALYKWLIQNYGKPGDNILDTHGGSFSSAIACYDLGFDLDICELDKEYFEAGKSRFDRHVNRHHSGMGVPIIDTNDYSKIGGLFQ